MIIKKDKQFNILPSHIELRKYILYYNIVFPENNMFPEKYTLMPNACATLSLAFDGFSINAELWGATTIPVSLGTEPNSYSVLLLIQLSPYGLYQNAIMDIGVHVTFEGFSLQQGYTELARIAANRVKEQSHNFLK